MRGRRSPEQLIQYLVHKNVLDHRQLSIQLNIFIKEGCSDVLGAIVEPELCGLGLSDQMEKKCRGFAMAEKVCLQR